MILLKVGGEFTANTVNGRKKFIYIGINENETNSCFEYKIQSEDGQFHDVEYKWFIERKYRCKNELVEKLDKIRALRALDNLDKLITSGKRKP